MGKHLVAMVVTIMVAKQRSLLVAALTISCVLLDNEAFAQKNAQKNPAARESNAAPQSASVFERIALKNRKVIRGLVVGMESDGQMLVAVRRAWLEKYDEAWYAKVSNESEELERTAYTQLRDRLTEMLKRREEWPLPGILENELDRADRWLKEDNHEPSQLMFLTIPKQEVARVDSPPTTEMLKAQWAWYIKADNPESDSSSSLIKQLESEKIAWQLETPELGDRFPARPQKDSEWNARIALYQYSHIESVSFQGTPDLMIRSGKADAPVEMGPIVSSLMKSQMQNLLNELSNDTSSKSSEKSKATWLRTAKQEAEKIEKKYLRATSVVADTIKGEVRVDTGFAVKFPDGHWEAIWIAQENRNANKPNKEVIERLEKDPQIAKIKGTVSLLGLGNSEQMDLALRVGAVTMEAQQSIDSKFEKVRQRYLGRLDLPMLRWEANTIPD